MIRSLYFSSQNLIGVDLDPKDFPKALEDTNGLLWVDFESTPPETDEPILREAFHFHPLAIDDALRETHIPKVDDWGEYIYVVLEVLKFDRTRPDDLEVAELDVFLGERYIVTHHDPKIAAVDKIWDSTQRNKRYLDAGPDHILYRLVDEIVGSYMPVVDEISQAIDLLEDEIFLRQNGPLLERILILKNTALHMRRVIEPEREVLNKLARDGFSVIDSQDRVYFRDVYDHLVRLQSITDSLRDQIGSTLDMYLSVVNNRMNDIMKTLTVITTLFMPLTFITGFFGMNFFAAEPPFSEWVSGPMLSGTLFVMALMPFIMFLWMRRRGWM